MQLDVHALHEHSVSRSHFGGVNITSRMNLRQAPLAVVQILLGVISTLESNRWRPTLHIRHCALGFTALALRSNRARQRRMLIERRRIALKVFIIGFISSYA